MARRKDPSSTDAHSKAAKQRHNPDVDASALGRGFLAAPGQDASQTVTDHDAVMRQLDELQVPEIPGLTPEPSVAEMAERRIPPENVAFDDQAMRQFDAMEDPLAMVEGIPADTAGTDAASGNDERVVALLESINDHVAGAFVIGGGGGG